MASNPLSLLGSSRWRERAGWLADQGVEHGEPVILTASSNESFVRSFWSCLFAGAVPVPLAVPSSWSKASPILDRFTNAGRLLGNPRVILDSLLDDDPHTPAHVRDRAIVLPRSLPDAIASPARDGVPDDTALIQFSSGSTGEPKGVVLSHRNVQSAFRRSTVFWLPSTLRRPSPITRSIYTKG